MSDLSSAKPNSNLPEYATICRILSVLSPDDSSKLVSRAFNRAWPTWSWHVKETGGIWHSANVAVINVDGTQVAADAKLWFAAQQKSLGQRGLIDHINRENLRLMRSEGTHLYVLGINPQTELDFIQVRIRSQRRAVCSLRDLQPWYFQERPDGYPFAWEHAENLTPKYQCAEKDVINSVCWLDRCKISHSAVSKAEYKQMEKRVVTRSFLDGTPPVTLSFLEAFPATVGWAERSSREARWFHDWRTSSAGNHPLGRFWYLQTSDYVDEDGFHRVGFIPQAVHWPRRKIRVKGHAVSQLMGKLDRFDRIVKHKFGWFFYMVHGNLITSNEGKAIAKGVRAGQIHLEPCDEAVLLAWDDDPYCF